MMNRPWRAKALRRRAAVIAVLFVAAAPVGDAQSVTALTGLSFGTILSGTTTSIAPTVTGAMSFDIYGPLGLNGGWTLTLPTSLARTGGGATMPITFCSTCGVFRISNTNPLGGTTFNPNTGVLGISLLSPLHVYVWIGGSVSPPLNQMSGHYTGTIVLTLAPII